MIIKFLQSILALSVIMMIGWVAIPVESQWSPVNFWKQVGDTLQLWNPSLEVVVNDIEINGECTGEGCGLSLSKFEATDPLTISTTTDNVIYSITQSSALSDGYLSAIDWNIFNSKWDGLDDLSLNENYLYVGNSSNNPEATSSLTINTTGDLIPLVTDSQNLGNINNTFENAHFTTENGTYVNIRQLAGLHRDYSEEAAILPYSISSSVTGGVWTITITDTSGAGYIAISINDKVIRSAGPTLSVDATAYAGTDLLPKTVYVYIQDNGSGVPELVASNTDPEGVVAHAHTANYKAGSVGASSVKIYGKTDAIVEMYKMATNVYHRFFVEGPVYNSGLAVTAISSDVTIGVGSYELIFELITTAEKQVSVDGLFYIKNSGEYDTNTDFSFDGEYSDGVTISNNKVFNVVLGVMEDDTTTIMALVQKGTTEEYISFTGAYEDASRQTVYQPTDTFLKNIFVPVARIIVQKSGDTYTLLQFDSGLYYEDLRGTTGAGGGSSAIASNILDGTAQGQMTFWDNTLGEWSYTETSELFWDDTAKTLSHGAFTFPNTDGTSGYVLKTDGAGTLTWQIDNGTAYTAGNSLTLDGTTFNVDDDFIKNTGDTASGDYTFDSGTLQIDSTNDRIGVSTSTPFEELSVVGQLFVDGSDISTSTIQGNIEFMEDDGSHGCYFVYGATTTLECF